MAEEQRKMLPAISPASAPVGPKAACLWCNGSMRLGSVPALSGGIGRKGCRGAR